MNYSLLENGADSLKGAHDSLRSFDNQIDGTDHNLKDAVIFLNHGIEILFKLILKEHSPALMFSNLKEYQNAKVKMKKGGESDVFDVNSSLRTVSLEEAVKRVELLCDIEITDQLKSYILYINKIRNKIMHYSISLSEQQLHELTSKLKLCYEESIKFLEIHIDGLKEKIEDSRFEMTYDEYLTEQAEIMAEMLYEDARIEEMERQQELMQEAEQDSLGDMMDQMEDETNH
ncbi:hypothetical protein [Evansella cellulosilytica]|uniref:Uncharacterized protein n=1 Tax=Evansella cellulosilytica (strain ATCC 21833 / DSM 2522 / FERM P-1141 / JCM 9156 / N-4) TaxID=649639 RepID=E6TVH9_EVAC2|nr:hypothetical protein [Evansella cellulosilytica]ADU30996.1 hypothetical protein Bcell_2741 [Evansella cellulosilytica DSM 2522]